MLIISAGMQKSGSAYFYNITNEILAESSCGKDARQIKNEKKLGWLLKWHNNNIGHFNFAKLIILWLVSIQAGTFVVKTHSSPTISAKILSKLGLIRIIYCYREPRDVLLSAIDHGQQLIESGQNYSFANMVNFDTAIQHVRGWLYVWQSYTDMPRVLTVKYEDMMIDPTSITKKIEEFIGVSVNPEKREKILWKFSKNNPDSDQKGMHFNKAKIFRYKTEMPEEQKVKCQTSFGEYLGTMGYEI